MKPMICKIQLHRELVRAARVRSLATMLFFVLWIPVVAYLHTIVPPDRPRWLACADLALVFGPPVLVSWGISRAYCRGRVACPRCGNSLWACGSRSFKPRRMRVTATCCPHCQTEIV